MHCCALIVEMLQRANVEVDFRYQQKVKRLHVSIAATPFLLGNALSVIVTNNI